MSVNVEEIGKIIENLYSVKNACEWDNSGFQVNLKNNTNRVLICVDVTPDVIREAAETGCWMIVSHHPLLFRPVKSIEANNYVGKCITALIKNDISLYSAHTSVDNAKNGISDYLADSLGLKNKRFLAEESRGKFYKVAVTVPEDNAYAIKKAMYDSGAGELGNYKGCFYSVDGIGSFIPNNEATPFIGQAGERELVKEQWVQALVPDKRLDSVLKAIRKAHPYEEPAIDVFMLKSPDVYEAGAGVIGELEKAKKIISLIAELKNILIVDSIRFKGNENQTVKKIAVCGGAGGDFIENAKRKGAQLYITGEVKHNIYVESDINIIEAGHYATERCFCQLMSDSLQKAFVDVKYNVAVRVAETEREPYEYY